MNKTNLVRCSVLLLLGACGTAGPTDLEMVEADTVVRAVPAEDGPRLSGFVDGIDTSDSALETVDKGFIDESLSCSRTHR